MKRSAKIGIGAGVVLAGIGTVYALGNGNLGNGLSTIGSTVQPCTGTITSGIPATLNPNYAAQSAVGGPAPGPSGVHEYPCLERFAPATLPVNGYQNGPAVTRPNGYVWLVIAENMTVTGTMSNGQSAASSGPWLGIAEYYNQQLVRVYPQRSGVQGLTQIGQWSGGYA